MRKNWKYLLLAPVVLLSAACAKEVNPEVAVPQKGQMVVKASFQESESASKVTIAPDGAKFKMSWEASGETAKLAESLLTSWSVVLYDSKSAQLDGEKIAFSFDPLTEPATAQNTSYDILYPNSAVLSGNARKLTLNLTEVQTPKADSPDPAAALLYGRDATERATQPTELSVTFKHLSAYGRMNLRGIPAAETITSIAISAEDCDMAGNLEYNTYNGQVSNLNVTSENTITILGDNLTADPDGFDVWFACKPFTLPAGKKFTIVTTTNVTTHQSVLTPAVPLSFEAGKVTSLPGFSDTFTVTFDSKGGSAVLSREVAIGRGFVPPADPSNTGSLSEGVYLGDIADAEEGALFEGWYTDEECTQKYDFSTPVTSSFTLYAKWGTRTPIDVSEIVPESSEWNAENLYPYKGITYVNNQTLSEPTHYTIIMGTDCTIWGGGITLNNSNAIVRLIGDGVERVMSRNNCSTFFTVAAGELILGKDLQLKYTYGGAGWETSPMLLISGGSGKLVIEEGCRLDGSVANHQLIRASASGAQIVMNGGSISSNSNNSDSNDFINLVDGSSFIMNGGTISDNTLKGRMLVPKPGTASELNGGTISGNSFAKDYLITVQISTAVFNMTGGSISGNTGTVSNHGAIIGCNWGIFTMSGGDISGNVVTTSSLAGNVGGAVFYGSNYSNAEHKFEKTGGTISGNTASRSAVGTITGRRGQQIIYAGQSKKIDADIPASTNVMSASPNSAPWINAPVE